MKPNEFHTEVPKSGFTLIETVITIGIVATLLAAFLALFGVATDSLHESINSREADRLVSALERELSILRAGEANADTLSPFDKAYQWIEKSSQGDSGRIFVYSYEGDPSSIRDDGFPEPKPAGATVGANSQMIPTARFVEDGNVPDEMRTELEATSGPVFFVKMTQLIYEDGKLVPGEPGIAPPHEGQLPLPVPGGSGSESYPEAVVAFKADFYLLPTNTPEYIERFTAENLRRPLFSRPLGVAR